jgi:hypothetical protein
MQVIPTKFTFVKFKSRRIFGNLSDFPKGLNPLKNLRKDSKWSCSKKIITGIMLVIGSGTNGRSCSE